jgi:hypothetical protein
MSRLSRNLALIDRNRFSLFPTITELSTVLASALKPDAISSSTNACMARQSIKTSISSRMVREAIGSALPKPRKKSERPRWKLRPAIEFIDAIYSGFHIARSAHPARTLLTF